MIKTFAYGLGVAATLAVLFFIFKSVVSLVIGQYIVLGLLVIILIYLLGVILRLFIDEDFRP